MPETTPQREFYILSAKHTHAPDRLATWWRPNNAGYCWHLPQAGRYSEEQVRANLDYYNSGCGTFAIPCDVVNAAAREFDLTADGETKPYLGVRRHWATLRRLIRACPFPFDRPEYAMGVWATILGRAEAPHAR